MGKDPNSTTRFVGSSWRAAYASPCGHCTLSVAGWDWQCCLCQSMRTAHQVWSYCLSSCLEGLGLSDLRVSCLVGMSYDATHVLQHHRSRGYRTHLLSRTVSLCVVYLARKGPTSV